MMKTKSVSVVAAKKAAPKKKAAKKKAAPKKKAAAKKKAAPKGDRAERIQRNKFEVVIGNEEVYVKGDVKIYVDGNYDLNVTGDIRINGKTINLNQGTKGAARIGDQTLDNDSELNGADTGIIQTGSSTVVIGN